MTFEEFFKKKRIDLVALQAGDPALFSEFETHYQQMGEKSFDHTKKYWFNKVRRQYQLAPEEKTEKPKIENQLAEQTVTESLIEEGAPAAPAPKLGFVPKFKAANMAKPAEEAPKTEEPAAPAPKLGFVPKFKAANMGKPTEEKKEEASPAEPAKSTETLAENTEAKPAYKPRFNMKNIPPKATGE